MPGAPPGRLALPLPKASAPRPHGPQKRNWSKFCALHKPPLDAAPTELGL